MTLAKIAKIAQTAQIALLACACASKQPVPPASTEDAIQLCVVDTIAPGGMMAIGAIVVHATRDTVVLQSEGRVPIGRLVAGPKVLSESKWIAPKQPLQLGTRLRFAAAGAPKAYAPGSITLLGMYRGTPVFAKAAEHSRIRAEIEALSARGVDLEKALQQRATLRRDADRLTNVYIPTSLVGCTFQQFRKLQASRRR